MVALVMVQMDIMCSLYMLRLVFCTWFITRATSTFSMSQECSYAICKCDYTTISFASCLGGKYLESYEKGPFTKSVAMGVRSSALCSLKPVCAFLLRHSWLLVLCSFGFAFFPFYLFFLHTSSSLLSWDGDSCSSAYVLSPTKRMWRERCAPPSFFYLLFSLPNSSYQFHHFLAFIC